MVRPINAQDIVFAGGSLQSALAAESSERVAADVALRASLAVEADERVTSVSGLSLALSAESGQRVAADVALSQAVASLQNSKQDASQRGQANGFAALDANQKVPIVQLPVGVTAGSVCAGDDPRLGGGGGSGFVRVAGNFSFGGVVGFNVICNVASANVVGVLPSSIPDGQVVRVYSEAIAGGSPFRFSFGLGPNTLNGGFVGFGNANSDCSQGSIAASLAAFGGTLLSSSVASWSPNQINLSDDDNPGEITFSIVGGPGGGSLSFSIEPFFLQVFVNGVAFGAATNVPLGVGVNTVRIFRGATPGAALDNFAAVNVAVATPSAWVDAAARNLGPGGYAELLGVSLVPTWAVVQRIQFGL